MDACLWIVPELISCHSQRLAFLSSALPVENLLHGRGAILKHQLSSEMLNHAT
jgi:hypothetical protein